jgi:hypothetical protein
MCELSETNYRGTGCGKAARPGLWGSGEATNRSTRTFFDTNDHNYNYASSIGPRKKILTEENIC